MIHDFNRHQVTRWTLTIVIFAGFCFMFYPFFTPLLLAALFGFAFDPVVSRYNLQKKRRGLATVLLIIGLFLMISLPVIYVTYRVVVKVQEAARDGVQNTPLYQAVHRLVSWFTHWAADLMQKARIDTDSLPDISGILTSAGSWIVAGSTAFFAYLPDFVLDLFVFTAALYFFLTESRNLKRSILKLDLLKATEMNKIIEVVHRSSYISLVATAVIGGLQAITVAMAAWVCGYREFLIVFVVTFVFSMVPVLGAAPVAVVLSLLSFVQGEYGAGIGLLVAAGIAGSVDNVVKPLIVNSSEEGLHPVVSLLAVIGAVLVYGIPGLLLGPVLTQLAFGIIPILFHEGEKEASVQEGESPPVSAGANQS